jgi:hypothetical protein
MDAVRAVARAREGTLAGPGVVVKLSLQDDWNSFWLIFSRACSGQLLFYSLWVLPDNETKQVQFGFLCCTFLILSL